MNEFTVLLLSFATLILIVVILLVYTSFTEGTELDRLTQILKGTVKKVGLHKDCSHYLGYLVSLPKNRPIPNECMGCSEIFECLENKKSKPKPPEKTLGVEGVDPYRTTTNDIQAVGRTLGIEAARNMIIQEAYNTLSEQGLNVDLRHIMLVSDVMTADGTIRAIGRHGVSKEKESVLSRAAFEITVSHLLQAARRGETDKLGGVAENIIVGQPVNLGTGAVELVMKRSKKKE